MFSLTDDFLSPLPGWIRYWGAEAGEPRAGSWSIGIPLAPFSADERVEINDRSVVLVVELRDAGADPG